MKNDAVQIMPSRMCRAGETIFAEGDAATEGLYYLCYGSVEISRTEPDGSRTLATLEEGSVFGEMAIMNSEPRNATAIAKTDCGLFAVNKSNFQHKVEQLDPVMRGTFRVLVMTVRDFLAQQSRWMEDRKTLLQQAKMQGDAEQPEAPEGMSRKLLF